MRPTNELLKELIPLTSDLFYVSETDAAVEPFTAGTFSGDLRSDVAILLQLDKSSHIQTLTLDSFFGKLSAQQEWYSPSQRERAERFGLLAKFLKAHLRDCSVFRIGQIRVEIIVAGVDEDGRVSGVRTFAVET